MTDGSGFFWRSSLKKLVCLNGAKKHPWTLKKMTPKMAYFEGLALQVFFLITTPPKGTKAPTIFPMGLPLFNHPRCEAGDVVDQNEATCHMASLYVISRLKTPTFWLRAAFYLTLEFRSPYFHPNSPEWSKKIPNDQKWHTVSHKWAWPHFWEFGLTILVVRTILPPL